MPSAISKQIRVTLGNELDTRPVEEQRRSWEEAVAGIPLPPDVTLTTLVLRCCM